jgi:hypothetical protein
MSIANVVPVDQDSIFISTGDIRAKIRDPLALAILTKNLKSIDTPRPPPSRILAKI